MEKWTEIKSRFIPFGDYGIEINIDGDTLIAYLEDSEKFKFTCLLKNRGIENTIAIATADAA